MSLSHRHHFKLKRLYRDMYSKACTEKEKESDKYNIYVSLCLVGGGMRISYTWCKDNRLECAWFANAPSAAMTFSFVINTPPLSLSRSFSPCAITGIHKNAKRFSKDTNSSARTFRNIADHFTLDSNYGREAKKDQKKKKKKLHFPTHNVQRLLSLIAKFPALTSPLRHIFLWLSHTASHSQISLSALLYYSSIFCLINLFLE